MLFNSQIFLLLFLPLALMGYYTLSKHLYLRKCWLIIASLVFYTYWDPRFFPLLAGSITANWFIARLMWTQRKRFLFIAGIAMNLLLIGIFKYANFFAGSIAWLLNTQHTPWSIILPLGISFFTFQQLSYLIDLYRGNAPLYTFTDYILYVTFFPQLIAGPIVRHDELIHQFPLDPHRTGDYERLSRGMLLLLCGLIKKLFIADLIAQQVDPVYATLSQGNLVHAYDAWLAMFGFGAQIYFDFSGYSDMAIGLGLMFGFTIPENFNAPYIALSLRDFWRRWHMTLSRFLRDYLYIPLGGNQHGAFRLFIALMLTMLIAGLWHGANWTFVAWGGLHGVGLVINHCWTKTKISLPKLVSWFITMSFVFFSWVIFRSESFSAANLFYQSLFTSIPAATIIPNIKVLWILFPAAGLALLGPTSQLLSFNVLQNPKKRWAIASGIAFVLVLLQAGNDTIAEFIYFQF